MHQMGCDRWMSAITSKERLRIAIVPVFVP